MAKSGRGLPRNLRRVSRDRVDALIVEREGMFRGMRSRHGRRARTARWRRSDCVPRRWRGRRRRRRPTTTPAAGGSSHEAPYADAQPP